MDDESTTLGGYVLLVKTTFDGVVVREWLPVALAVDALSGPEMGTRYASARIVAVDDVDIGKWDRSP